MTCYGGVVGWFTELGQAPVMLLVSGNLGKLGRSSLGGTGRAEYLFYRSSRGHLCLVDCSVQVDMEQSSPAPSWLRLCVYSFQRPTVKSLFPKPAPWHDDVWCGAASLYQAPGPSMPANYPPPYTTCSIRTGTVSAYTQTRAIIRATICIRTPHLSQSFNICSSSLHFLSLAIHALAGQ